MSKLKDTMSKTMGSISAMETMLERYPTLTTTDSMLTNASINTSVGFLIQLLSILGVSHTDLIKWVSKLLSDSGFFDSLENVVKAILLANIKEMWSCSVNPLLPDSLMKYSNPIFPDGTTRVDPYTYFPEDDENLKKIEIDLNEIDIFGILNNCPSDKDGSIFYFDSYQSICYPNDQTRPFLSPNNLWKSCDFNAYLWYIINKGTLSNPTDLQYSCWDNRNKYTNVFKDNKELRDSFFNIENCMTSPENPDVATKKTIGITDSGETIYKKQIILCQFNERPTPSQSETSLLAPSSNVLRVWINANRYYHTEKIVLKDPKSKKDVTTEWNKTIFEFNYDYIYSLKLFDVKSMISQIVNSLLGLTASISFSYSIQQKQIEAKVSEMVKKVIQSDDTSTNICYYNFTNDEYDKLLNESTEKYSGVYETNTTNGSYAKVNTQAILESLRNIKQSDNVIEQEESITKTLEEVMEIVAEPDSIEKETKFSYSFAFIQDFLEQTVSQIVIQVLSPKVAILYKINGAIMGGDVADLNSWKDFIQDFPNLLLKIIKEVKDILVKELYKFVLDKLKPLIELMISRIALETVMYYKELIEQLLFNCVPNVSLPSNGQNMIIDNVNYADITTEAQPTDYDNDTKC